jgi:hypothetical protein
MPHLTTKIKKIRYRVESERDKKIGDNIQRTKTIIH